MSWVIVENATGKAVFETFNKKTADAINTDKYKAMTALSYLVGLNAKIKAGA